MASIGEICELILAEYHLPPEYILENWTEDKLALMLRKRNERVSGVHPDEEPISKAKLSKAEFFELMGIPN
jgi:hypothetical protein